MKSLYDQDAVDEVKRRMQLLRQDTPRLWGKMDAAQMLAHCAANVQMGLAEVVIPRSWVGRLIGPMFKSVYSNEKPLGKSTPTAAELVMSDAREVDVEREKLAGLIDRFARGGRAGCTQEPHCFFGKMSPEEWGKGMYKHLDHHLKQFGV